MVKNITIIEYSLKNLVCLYNGSNLRTIATVYKQYGQSMVKFIETNIKQLKVKQNVSILS